jgi:hypothetical protein
MELGGSLSHSQEPAICPYPEPAQSSQSPPSHFLKIHFVVLIYIIQNYEVCLVFIFWGPNYSCTDSCSWASCDWKKHMSVVYLGKD